MTIIKDTLRDIAGGEAQGWIEFMCATIRDSADHTRTITTKPVRIQINSSGSFTSPQLDPGPAIVTVCVGDDFRREWPIVIPNSSTEVRLYDLLDQYTEVPAPVVSQAWAAAQAAIHARNEVDAFVQIIGTDYLPQIATHAQSASDSRVAAEEAADRAFEAIPPATDTQLGKIKLRGDLGGTADDPTVPALTGKRDIVAGMNRVYTTDASGTQANIPYSSSATATTIMLRDTAGRTKVGTPTAAADAVTKEYVDTLLAKKADLGADGKTLQAQQNAIAVTDFLGNVASQTAMLALVGQRGDWCNRTDLGTEWQLVAEPSTSLSSWMQKIYPASDVTSVHGRKGAITTSSADITDATATGRALMKATDAAAARSAIDAPAQADLFQIAMDLGSTIDGVFVALNLRDAGLWSASGTYEVGQVVTYNHGRYYCRESHTPVATFPAAKYVWLGLAAVAATSDPGGGRLWVKI